MPRFVEIIADLVRQLTSVRALASEAELALQSTRVELDDQRDNLDRANEELTEWRRSCLHAFREYRRLVQKVSTQWRWQAEMESDSDHLARQWYDISW